MGGWAARLRQRMGATKLHDHPCRIDRPAADDRIGEIDPGGDLRMRSASVPLAQLDDRLLGLGLEAMPRQQRRVLGPQAIGANAVGLATNLPLHQDQLLRQTHALLRRIHGLLPFDLDAMNMRSALPIAYISSGSGQR
jgi:hypothetical protein